MHLKFYRSLHKPIEYEFPEWFSSAVRDAGDTLDIGDATEFSSEPEADIAVLWGLSGITRDVIDAYRAAGKRTLMLDKAAIRRKSRSRHYRVLLDGGTALPYLMRKRRPSDRWEAMDIEVKPWRKHGSHIIYADNSQKVHDYWRLAHVNEMARSTIAQIVAAMPGRGIVYRPKPQDIEFQPIEGSRLSVRPERIESILNGAHCLVTYTSHCSIDALIAGVPVICLGPNPAEPLAGSSLEQILNPPVPSDQDRNQFFCNLAYCQWSRDELASGEAWAFIKGELATT
jgi:hypothetical protein